MKTELLDQLDAQRAVKCPYCAGEMAPGYLCGYAYRSRWLPDSQTRFMNVWAFGGEPIGRFRILGRPRIRAHRCGACAKIIIDLKDAENIG